MLLYFRAKPKNHTSLFEEFNFREKSSYEMTRGTITHKFRWVNEIAINYSNHDCKVNVLEYEKKPKKNKNKNDEETSWVWVTDIPLCKENVFEVMQGGRARHKIENETFNTLEPVYDLFINKAKKARFTNCKLVFSFLSVFFHKRLHFSNHENERSTIHLLEPVYNLLFH